METSQTPPVSPKPLSRGSRFGTIRVEGGCCMMCHGLHVIFEWNLGTRNECAR